MMNAKDCSLFLAGFGIGAAVAAIMTPKSGMQLRRDAGGMVSSGMRALQEGVEGARKTISKQATSLDAAVKQGVAAYKEASATTAPRAI